MTYDAETETRLLKEGVARIPREWFRANEWVVLAQGLGDLAVLAAGAWLCLFFPTILGCSPMWVRVPVWVLMAGRIHGLGVLMHDLVHLQVLKREPLKKLLFDAVICWPILINMDYYGLAHAYHHQESNVAGRDPYFVPLHERHPAAYVPYVVIGSLLLFVVLAVRIALWPFGVAVPAFKRSHIKFFSQLGASPDLESAERAEAGKAIWIWCAGPLVFWAAVCAALSVNGMWHAFTMAYGIPMLVSTVLGQLRLACDHIYTQALGSSLVEQVAGATNVEAPWWQQVVMGAHGTSYHALHHVVPTLPNYRLRAAHELMKQCGSQVYAQTIYRSYGEVLAQLIRAQFAWSRAHATPA